MFTIPNEADAAFTAQAAPSAADIAALVAGFEGQGVLSGCAVAAQGTPDMTVAVAGGSVLVAGDEVAVAGGSVAVATAHATLDRVDLVVVDDSGTGSAVAGTAATIPVPPAIPASSVLLAMVYVPAATTSVGSTQITDKRVVVNDVAVLTEDGGLVIAGHSAMGTGTPDQAWFGTPTHSLLNQRETFTGDFNSSQRVLQVIEATFNPTTHGYPTGAGYTSSWAQLSAAEVPALCAFDLYEVNSGLFVARHAGSGTVAMLAGVEGRAFNLGEGDVLEAFGVWAAILSSGTGNIDKAYGLKVDRPGVSGGGSITNAYGLYLDDQSGLGTTRSENIRSAGPNSTNVFEGSVVVEGTLSVAGDEVGGDETLWTPAEIPSTTMKLWLNPDGLPASGAIASWTDSSGNGNDAAQATGTAQPVVAAGLNGHDCASFDGVDDFLATSAYACTHPEAVFLFMRMRSSTHNAVSLCNISGGVRAFRDYSGGMSMIMSYGYENIVIVQPGTALHRLYSAFFNGARSTLSLDDKIARSGPGNVVFAAAANGIGLGGTGIGASSAAIDVLEVIHLQGMPDPTLTARIQDYFGRKYGTW
jgi:hypothetical protein